MDVFRKTQGRFLVDVDAHGEREKEREITQGNPPRKRRERLVFVLSFTVV